MRLSKLPLKGRKPTAKIKDATDDTLWREMLQRPSQRILNELFCRYKDHAELLAERYYHSSIKPNSINSIEDLTQAAYLGLMEAIERFDWRLHDNFKIYSRRRINGAMLDEVRSMQNFPRSAAKAKREYRDACNKLSQDKQRSASPEEILGKDVDSLLFAQVYQVETHRTPGEESHSIFLSEIEGTESIPGRETKRDRTIAFENLIKECIENERVRYVIWCYYVARQPYHTIAEILGCCLSTIVNIRREGEEAIKERYPNYESLKDALG